jgi:hypothetical protein
MGMRMASSTEGGVMSKQRTYTGVMRQVIASLTVDRERTLRDVTRIHADLLEKSRDVAVRIGTSEDVPLAEALDVEQTATLAAAADLLCQAHASPDPRLLAEAEVRAECICSMLDEITDAGRAGDPETMRTIRHDVGVALEAYAKLIRAA